MVKIPLATTKFVSLNSVWAGNKACLKAHKHTRAIPLHNWYPSWLEEWLMNFPSYHCYSLFFFTNRAELIPLLDHKVKTDCYQEPNWHKGHPTSVDVLEIRSTQCPRDTRSYMAKGISNNRIAREVLTRYRKKLFYGEDNQALEQVAQRGCTVFIPSEVFKVWLDKALSNLVWPHSWPSFIPPKAIS